MGTVLILWIAFGSMDISTIVIISIPEYKRYFHLLESSLVSSFSGSEVFMVEVFVTLGKVILLLDNSLGKVPS